MPLSLAFRRQRPAARPVEAPPRPPSAPDLPAAIVRLSNHIHYHTRRGARLFVQGGQGGGSVSPPPLPQPILPAAPVPHALAPAPSSELRIWRLDRLVSRERVETRRQVEGGERLVSVRRLLRSRTATERNVILRVGDAAGRAPLPREAAPAAALPAPVSRLRRLVAHSMGESHARPAVVHPARASSPRLLLSPADTPLEPPLARRARRHQAPAAPDNVADLVARTPVPIVWRQPPARPEAAGAVPQPARAPGLPAGAPAPAIDAAPPAPTPAAAPQPAAWKFDGAAIDRLAEDVMQRIDRRIRIERERRGI